MIYNIQVARPEDGPAVTELLQASYPVLMKSAYAPETLPIALHYMTQANAELLSSGTYFIAKNREGQIISCGGWTIERPGDKALVQGIGHVRHFGTHPDWTGHGAASQIMTECQQQAEKENITCFECFASLNAEGFYAKQGFVALKRTSINIRDQVTFPIVHMEKRF